MHISVAFSGCTTGLCYISNLIISTINNILVPVIFAIAFIVFLWGIANAYVLSRGNEAKVKQGHQLILWGLVGFFFMLSIWGLVNILVNTFNISGGSGPPTPTYFPYTYGQPTSPGYNPPAAQTPVPAANQVPIP